MKKLAIVCGSLAHGGAERVSVYLAQHIREYGIECDLITMNRASMEYDLPNEVKRYDAHDYSTNIFIGLRKAYRQSNADVYLIMSVSNCIYAIPPLLCKKKKIVVSERNSPLHFAGSKFVKVVSRRLMRWADGFVFQTEQAKDFYKRSLHGKGVVIPNPLITKNLPDPYEGIRDKRIVAVGRLVAQKNHELLIDAFSRIISDFPDYSLEIYGEGPLHDSLQERIDNRNLQAKVFLKGNVNDVFNKISKASVFVMSSNFEGMPNALIEAMAMGLPCISTDCPCGGPKSLIEDGHNGMLVSVGDAENLAKSIETVLQNKDLACNMSKNAIEIRNRLDAKKVVSEWYNYLKMF